MKLPWFKLALLPSQMLEDTTNRIRKSRVERSGVSRVPGSRFLRKNWKFHCHGSKALEPCQKEELLKREEMIGYATFYPKGCNRGLSTGRSEESPLNSKSDCFRVIYSMKRTASIHQANCIWVWLRSQNGISGHQSVRGWRLMQTGGSSGSYRDTTRAIFSNF